MKEYPREKYNLKEYQEEKYMMEIVDEENHILSSKYSDKWELLYQEAKELAEKGKHCSIYELKFEFIG